MRYSEIVKTVPVEKWESLSNRLVDLILESKNADKMSISLANTVLYYWHRDLLVSDVGLATLLEAASLLEPNKMMEVLELELQLVEAAKKIRKVLRRKDN